LPTLFCGSLKQHHVTVCIDTVSPILTALRPPVLAWRPLSRNLQNTGR
jgi:hypothetical protein